MTEALPRIGVAVLVWRGERLLLGRRLSGHGAGTWQLPGGHLEPREAILSCARREVREETGLALDCLSPAVWTETVFPEAGLRYLTLFVLARHADGGPTTMEPRKSAQWAFFDTGALPSPLFAPLQRALEEHPGLLSPGHRTG